MKLYLMLIICFCASAAPANPKIVTDQSHIQLANQLAERAIESGDINLAKILKVNAYNRDKTRFSQLKDLHEFFHKYESDNPVALNELIQLTERALYLMSPKEISSGVLLLERLYQKRQQHTQSAEGSTQANLIAQKLLDYDDQQDHIEQLNQHINSLEQVLLNKAQKLSVPVLKKLQMRFRKLSHDRQLFELSKELERYVTLLKQTQDKRSPRARARSLMVHNTLNLLYSEGIENTHSAIKAAIESQIKKAEAELLNIGRIQSAELHQKALQEFKVFEKDYVRLIKGQSDNQDPNDHITALVETLSSSDDSDIKYQDLVDRGKPLIENISSIINKISDMEIRKKVITLLEKTRTLVQDILTLQSKAYNKWAAQQVLEARKLLNGEFSLNDEEAIAFFKRASLSAIDVKYISPEVNTIYMQIIQEIFAELPSGKVLKLQRAIILGEKRAISSF